jgi:hypothetical protein
MTIPVPHYGLHTSDEGVVFLHQGRASNNFIGLKAVSPFQVYMSKSRPCPHLINGVAPIPDVVQWQKFAPLLMDPLVQVMLPIPKQAFSMVPYLPDPQNEMTMILVLLSRLSSPIYPVIHPLRKLTKAALLDEMASTNVSPLVLTGVQCEDNSYVNEIARDAWTLPRRVIFTGDPAVVIRAPLERIRTNLWVEDAEKLAVLPMESLGALLLRRHARGERLDTDIVKGNVS